MQDRITPLTSRYKCGEVLPALALVLLWCLPAHCRAATEDSATSMFSLSGFGTLGVVHSSDDEADYIANPLQPSGAGYTRSWSPDLDSRLGAQLTAHLAPQISAMLQIISEQQSDGSFRPHVEWANVAYQPTTDFKARFGRIVLPTFLLSDSRKVGYANPWVRPPAEFYALSPIFNSDGADVSYQAHVGGAEISTVATFGKTNFAGPQNTSFDVRDLWVLAETFERGPLTLHAAYAAASYSSTTLSAVFDAFRLFGPQGTILADRYAPDDKRVDIATAGAMYDPGRWFAMGEWGTRDLHSAVGESTAWYVSGGCRLAKFTPYLTYAKTKSLTKTSDPGLNVGALPPHLAAEATGLNAALNAALATNGAQATLSAGVRWDMMSNVDLKLQYDRIDLGRGSAGTLVNVQPGFQPGSSVNLVSLALDFVW